MAAGTAEQVAILRDARQSALLRMRAASVDRWRLRRAVVRGGRGGCGGLRSVVDRYNGLRNQPGHLFGPVRPCIAGGSWQRSKSFRASFRTLVLTRKLIVSLRLEYDSLSRSAAEIIPAEGGANFFVRCRRNRRRRPA